MYTTFHPISEVETTALWLPILGKCPEIYRVIVMGLRPSRWPSKKDWLDASNESASLTLFYLRIKRILFLSININFIYFRQNFSYTNTKLSIWKSVRALKKKNVIDKTRLLSWSENFAGLVFFQRKENNFFNWNFYNIISLI